MASKQKRAKGYWGVLEPFWEKINIDQLVAQRADP